MSVRRSQAAFATLSLVLIVGLSSLSSGEQAQRANGYDVGSYLPEAASSITIDTVRRRMIVKSGSSLDVFRVALGPAPDDPKQFEGDGRTPRGRYTVCNRFRADRFHRFLALSYPSPQDAKRGLAKQLLSPLDFKVILDSHGNGKCPSWDTSLGGHIGIHGWGQNETIASRHAAGDDWTDGCIGVTNVEIEGIYERIYVGTPVIVY